ncbi:MAG: phosphoglucosamine mutase [Desulfobacterales bacterium]
MGRLFGTDGIRGVANQYPITVEMAVNVGRAVASIFAGKKERPKIIIGKDTRISGDMIEHAIASGICSMGADTLLAGVMPTPAIACLTIESDAAAGIVISASHNPFYDNGIKIFNGNGCKLSDPDENEVEEILLSGGSASDFCRTIQKTGRVNLLNNGAELYLQVLKNALPPGFSLKGVTIALDCSNGAMYNIAPTFFSMLGAKIETIFDNPDGLNINHNCGSQHTASLQKLVKKTNADIGLAFDGDGDRLIAVDEKGNEISGDQIMLIGAKFLQENNKLRNNLLVTTVMSNIGLKMALGSLGIDHCASEVGDRCVMKMMQNKKAVLGGEDSGHIIYLDHQTTGDGLLAGIKLIEAMLASEKPLSVLSKMMTVFPQKLINIDVKKKPDLQTIPSITNEIKKVEKLLGSKGRVLVRYSGTQQKCRVMVEGPTPEETEKYCNQIANAVKNAIGAG